MKTAGPLNYYKYFLLAILLVVWVWSMWHPFNGKNWFLENKLVFLFVPIAYYLFVRYITFSKLSLTCITLFIILHVIGAHYSYGSVPFGLVIGDMFNAHTNMYDKFVHFSFGLLIVYPLREAFLRVAKIQGFWSYLVPLMAIVTLGTIYEIYEWVTVLQYDPKTGYMFIGGNDPFDTTKDLLSALLGATVTMSALALFSWKTSKDSFMRALRKSFTKDTNTFPIEDIHVHKKMENVA